jgi:hypothetical protein
MNYNEESESLFKILKKKDRLLHVLNYFLLSILVMPTALNYIGGYKFLSDLVFNPSVFKDQDVRLPTLKESFFIPIVLTEIFLELTREERDSEDKVAILIMTLATGCIAYFYRSDGDYDYYPSLFGMLTAIQIVNSPETLKKIYGWISLKESRYVALFIDIFYAISYHIIIRFFDAAAANYQLLIKLLLAFCYLVVSVLLVHVLRWSGITRGEHYDEENNAVFNVFSVFALTGFLVISLAGAVDPEFLCLGITTLLCLLSKHFIKMAGDSIFKRLCIIVVLAAALRFAFGEFDMLFKVRVSSPEVAT